jgi:hypothetical protein
MALSTPRGVGFKISSRINDPLLESPEIDTFL